jgi:hypothetical protein
VRFAELRDCNGQVATTNATAAAPSSRPSCNPSPPNKPLQERTDVDRVPMRRRRQHTAFETERRASIKPAGICRPLSQQPRCLQEHHVTVGIRNGSA